MHRSDIDMKVGDLKQGFALNVRSSGASYLQWADEVRANKKLSEAWTWTTLDTSWLEDALEDGALSEVDLDQMFKRYDASKNGSLDTGELHTLVIAVTTLVRERKVEQQTTPANRDHLKAKFDGLLRHFASDQGRQEVTAKFDPNGDKSTSKEEFVAAFPNFLKIYKGISLDPIQKTRCNVAATCCDTRLCTFSMPTWQHVHKKARKSGCLRVDNLDAVRNQMEEDDRKPLVQCGTKSICESWKSLAQDETITRMSRSSPLATEGSSAGTASTSNCHLCNQVRIPSTHQIPTTCLIKPVLCTCPAQCQENTRKFAERLLTITTTLVRSLRQSNTMLLTHASRDAGAQVSATNPHIHHEGHARSCVLGCVIGLQLLGDAIVRATPPGKSESAYHAATAAPPTATTLY